MKKILLVLLVSILPSLSADGYEEELSYNESIGADIITEIDSCGVEEFTPNKEEREDGITYDNATVNIYDLSRYKNCKSKGCATL
jgi:hypothetical protein